MTASGQSVGGRSWLASHEYDDDVTGWRIGWRLLHIEVGRCYVNVRIGPFGFAAQLGGYPESAEEWSAWR